MQMKNRLLHLFLLWTIPLFSQRIGPASVLAELELDSLLQIPISASARYDQTVSEAPSSVTIVTHEDILKYGYRSFDELLRSIRGFFTSDDRNYSYVGIRGFGRPTDYNLLKLVQVVSNPKG
jgi:outer membrane receptor for ferrienterochelin and colicin